MGLQPTFLRPSPLLAPYVSYYFAIEAEPPAAGDAAHAVNVLPVPHPQLVFAYGDPSFERTMGGPPVPSPDVAVTGFMSQTVEYLCPGRLGVIMVGLHPWGLRPFLAGAIPEIVDRNIPLATLLRRVEGLDGRLRTAVGLAERIAQIEALLVQNLRQVALDQPVVEAVETILEKRGQVLLQALADDAGIGLRQFRRRFGASVGIEARRFIQLARFQATFEALDRQPSVPDWTAIALEAGYFDQSHFINAFRSFTRFAPGAYMRRMQRTETGRAFDAAIQAGDPATRMYV